VDKIQAFSPRNGFVLFQPASFPARLHNGKWQLAKPKEQNRRAECAKTGQMERNLEPQRARRSTEENLFATDLH
jgi:hypothetical protein